MKATASLGRWLAPDVSEFAPGLLAIQQSPPPKLPRAVFYTVGLLFAVLLSWALVARLDIVAVAEGRLVPASYTKIVQPAEAGIVKDILVREGDEVAQGQVLIRLDATLAGADSRTVAAELGIERLTLRRIDAELQGRPLLRAPGDDPAHFGQIHAEARERRQAYVDALAQETAASERAEHELAAARETLAKLQATSGIAQQSAQAHQSLVAEGFLSPIAASEKAKEAVEKAQDLKAQASTVQSLQATIVAQVSRIAALTSNYRTQLLGERTQVVGRLAKLEEESRKVSFRAGLLELRAPQAGTVKDVATTTKGAVVQPGMVLLTLVPKGEQLLAEVQIRNEDVGFVQPGQEVKIKVAAYPFQKYGLIEGKVSTIAPDAHTAEDGAHQVALGYRALVKLKGQALPSLQRQPLEPGMQVTAEIHQGKRTVMEYLTSPIQKAAHEAGRER